MKNFLKVLLSLFLILVTLAVICVASFFIFYTPTLTADMSSKTGEVTNGASGYLYGIAEEGVPSKNMTESIDISTASAKVTDGLQHPVGDISHVSSQLENTDYNVVYLQDAYSTWYYENDSIEQQRATGRYNWKVFVTEDFLPKVEKSVNALSKAPYGDKVVYCLYNECDNGVWFGETVINAESENGAYGDFNSQGEAHFFEAWKMTYDFVKSINPDALIGGPGYCDYDSGEIERFMSYCAQNDCLPDVMIYHELSDYSVRFWQQHVNDYRRIETALGVEELPIIVTEYGRMCDTGLPGNMLQYITQIENTKVYGDIAYWRLANNLCDVCADDNTPNANWWLYRWYTDMEGQTVESKYQDLFKSNFENAFIKKKAEYTSWGFMGIVAISDNEDKIEVICGGRDGSAAVKLKNLNDTAFKGQKVQVKIEEVLYEGLSGAVYAPVTKQIYYTNVKNSMTVDLNDMDGSSAYHIVITPVAWDEGMSVALEDYTDESYIERYEFEDGTLLGNAYLYNNWYACTGGNDDVINEMDIVGGMENDGDGVSLTVDVPRDGTYNLGIIYGNSSDGAFDENGRQDPDDRAYSTSIFTVDGEETVLSFENTIKSEYTNCLNVTYELTKGKHTVSLKHGTGTIVLDSLLVTEVKDNDEIAVLYDNDRSRENASSYLVVAPEDAYYDVYSTSSAGRVNDIEVTLSGNHNTVYLMRGLNFIDLDNTDGLVVSRLENEESSLAVYTAEELKLEGSAVLNTDNAEKPYITGISGNGGSAGINVNTDKSGTYALTFEYSNNAEGGVHDYNIDLIERYVTVTVGGKSQDVYCRNTYCWDTYKTVTCYVDLKQGSNTVLFTNSGNNSFNGQETYIPNIASVTISEICK